MKKKKQAFNSN